MLNSTAKPADKGQSRGMGSFADEENDALTPRGESGRVRLVMRRATWFFVAALLVVLSLAGIVGWASGSSFGGKVRNDPLGELSGNPVALTFQLWDRFLSAYPHPALAAVAANDSSDDSRTRLDKLDDEYERVDPEGGRPDGIYMKRLKSDDYVRVIECAQRCVPIRQTGRQLFALKKDLLDGTLPNAANSLLVVPSPDSNVSPLTLADVSSAILIDSAGRASAIGRNRRGAKPEDDDPRLFKPGSGVAVGLAILADSASGKSGTERVSETDERLIVIKDTNSQLSALFVTGAKDLVQLARPGEPYFDPRKVAGSVDTVLFASAAIGWARQPSAEEDKPPEAIYQTLDGGRTWSNLSYRHLPAPWIFVALLASVFAFERGTRAHQALNPVSGKRSVAEHGVSDDPIGLNALDALGLRPIARSVSRFIRNVDTTPTVTVGVTGPWGSGKSSLMTMIAEDLKEHRVRSVWFNAWHHQKEDSLLAALLAAIREQAIPPVWTLPGLHYRLRVAWHRTIDDLARSVALIALAVVAVVLVMVFGEQAIQVIKSAIQGFAALFGQNPPPPPTKDQGLTPGVIASVGLSTGGLGGLVYAVRQVWNLFKPLRTIPSDLLASVSDQAKARDLDQQLSFRFRFSREFNTFCKLLRSSPHPGLVIFVDDLDRCLPRQTVEVLEAINFVTTAGPCFVILGFDESKVRAAIADVYKDTLLKIDEKSKTAPKRPGGIDLRNFATNYLEKLVHLTIPVPRSREDTVQKLLGLGASPPAQPVESFRTRIRRLEEPAGTLLVLAFFGLSAFLSVQFVTRFQIISTGSGVASAVKIEPAPMPVPTPAASAVRQTNESVAAAAPPTPAVAPPLDPRPVLERLGISQTRDLVGMSAPVPLSAMLLFTIILAMQYVPRLTSVPVVEDSDDFKASLQVWVPVIALRRETPRAVKRFVNRVRFLAMRAIDVTQDAERSQRPVPLDEAMLVTFAAIEDADAALLGKSKVRVATARGAHRAPGDRPETSAALVRAGLERFEEKFKRDPYADEKSVGVYRAIAGIFDEPAHKTNAGVKKNGKKTKAA